MNDLKDLLRHEIMDLASAEQQIIEALPAMIEKASNDQLKNALSDHLRVTEQQKTRLEKVQELLEEGQPQAEDTGLLSRLFKSNVKCRAMKGLIEEGEKVMDEDMSPEVMDAAIIACAQKIEHYEISSYGTTRTWARELGLEQVARLLEETLNEEYGADDLLTMLAESKVNQEAEKSVSIADKNRTRHMNPSAGTSTSQHTRERANRRVEEMEPVANARSVSRNGSTPASGKNSPASKSAGSRSSSTSTRSAASKTAGASAKKSGSSGRSASSKSTSGGSRSTGRTTSGGRGGNINAGRNKSR